MLPFGIGFSEVLLILVVVLLVVGPHKLPDMARTLGKGVRTLRRAGDDLRDAIQVDEIKRSIYEAPRDAWRNATSLNHVEDVEPVETDSYESVAAADDAAAAAAAAHGEEPETVAPEATASTGPSEAKPKASAEVPPPPSGLPGTVSRDDPPPSSPEGPPGSDGSGDA